MKRVKIYNLLIFLLGLGSLSLGIVLVVKAKFGVSVATSPPYVLSLYFTKISFGMWNYIIHGFVLFLLVLTIRKLTVKHLSSFIVAFLFGLTIDMFNLLLKGLDANTLLGRLGLFALGSVIISIGVAGFLKSNFPVLPFDTFVREVSQAKNIKYSKFKTSFDLVCFTLSLSLSLVFFRQIRGINIGTLVSALILGSMIGKTLDLMNKHIEGVAIFPEEKTSRILDLNLLKLRRGE